VVVVVVAAIGLSDLVKVGIKLDELIGDVYQPRAGVAAKTGQLYANAFVSDGIYRLREILVA